MNEQRPLFHTMTDADWRESIAAARAGENERKAELQATASRVLGSLAPAWTTELVEQLTAETWAWLFDRFRQVRTPMIGFARRMQTTTGAIEKLSADQRRWVLALSFKYRRQIFRNSAEWKPERFVAAVERAATKAQTL